MLIGYGTRLGGAPLVLRAENSLKDIGRRLFLESGKKVPHKYIFPAKFAAKLLARLKVQQVALAKHSDWRNGLP